MKIKIFKKVKDKLKLTKATARAVWSIGLDMAVKDNEITQEEARAILEGKINTVEELVDFRNNRSQNSIEEFIPFEEERNSRVL